MTRTGCLFALVVAALLGQAAVLQAADVQTITHGREVDLEDHLVPGKYVLFDFYADWCGPCRALEPRLLDLAGRHTDRLALRKVDIINWDSAVARQYRLSSIPHMVLYGPDGDRIAAGDAGTVLGRLQSGLGDGGQLGSPAAPGSTLVPMLALAAVLAAGLGLVVRKRRPGGGASPPETALASLRPVDTAANPSDPAIWFAMLQQSLEGPLTRAQLRELVGRGTLDQEARVRRRGDSTWRQVRDVTD